MTAAGPAGAASVGVPNVSGNWAGYVATGANITSVTGSWTVPSAGTVPPGLSATWVGIGGYSTTDLIQAGTQQSSAPYSSVFAGGAYGAWYELLPANPVYFTGCSGDPTCSVSPGDQMSVTITNGGSGNSWTIDVADAGPAGTGKWTYTNTNVNYVSSESSAEWIHEAPSAAGAVPIPVGGSGTVTFDGANRATINGATETIGQSNAISTVALPVETTVSALDSDGDGFNVCTYSLTCSASAS
ncbi:MAG TPA: hypothetical protein VMU63_05485 [Acidimicrobiales bacterium]|nr:hypothetical protein [Acidimicrobiales bacterium]